MVKIRLVPLKGMSLNDTINVRILHGFGGGKYREKKKWKNLSYYLKKYFLNNDILKLKFNKFYILRIL